MSANVPQIKPVKDMKEEILSIASDLREGHITSNEAKRLLLVLFGVGKPTVITRLEDLKVGDTYKYNPNDVGIFKVLGRQDENWIKVVRTQSGRITGSFPWIEVYPVNVL